MAENPVADLLPKLTSRGDTAAFGLGYVGGFVLDVVFGFHGVTQGGAGVCGGILVLSIKNAVQAFVESHTSRLDVLRKCKDLESFITQQSGASAQADLLRAQYELWRMGLLSSLSFKEKMAQIGQDVIAAKSQRRLYGKD